MKVLVLLQILVLALLFTLARASPLDPDDENDTHLLFGRATGAKYVGSNCTSSAECYSANCVKTNQSSSLGTCQRQVNGGTCLKDANCASYNCDGGACSETPKLFGKCIPSVTCIGNNIGCYGAICLYAEGAICTSPKQCASNGCVNGACTKISLPPNKACNSDDECASGFCHYPDGYGCRDTNGNPVDCPLLQVYLGNNEYANICARYPLGYSCANQGDCQIGLCRNGTCSANGAGKTCKYDNECSDIGARCDSGKCRARAKGTANAHDICDNDAQCFSGHCVRSVYYKDNQGVKDGLDRNVQKRYTQDVDAYTCDYLY
ncbi:hypothetical protein V8E36_002262 [Tilletia maclaganii]